MNFLFVFSAVFSAQFVHISGKIVLDSVQGKVQGDFETTTRGNTQYAIFYGIPYAKPPVGKLRFKAPEPAEPWNGVYDNRISMKSVCLQNAYFFEHASEDCLYLNVATPALNNSDIDGNLSLPVMVWIHGGGWTSGSYDPLFYNPDFLMDQEVVFVSVNYRLGALGFFALEHQAFGNQGLRDQTLALQWVQQNIGIFGGDPNEVTIFGESAGAYSVFYQTLSPMAKGLFKRTIAESGSNLGPSKSAKTQENAFRMGAEIATHTECNSTVEDLDNSLLMDCLQNIKGNDIIQANIYGKVYASIDKVLDAEAFLPDSPRNILESGEINGVDLLLGVNQDEALMWLKDYLRNPHNDTIFANVRDNWDTFAPRDLFDQHGDDITEEVLGYCNQAADFYLEGSIDNYNYDHIDGIVKMLTDAWFWYSADDWARLALQNNINTYQYIFGYEGLFGFVPGYGVSHADEVIYIFGGALSSIMPSHDVNVSQNMIDWWTNFAKYGYVLFCKGNYVILALKGIQHPMLILLLGDLCPNLVSIYSSTTLPSWT